MAITNNSRPARPRARSSGNLARTHPRIVASTTSGTPANIEQVVQRESRRLQKALAVLTCLREAAETEVEVDLSDVAAVACDLVDKALYELDLAGLSGGPDDSDADVLRHPMRKDSARCRSFRSE
jgi:hypothetical protein